MSMIERIARAIYMAHWDAGVESKRGQDHRFPPMWDAASSPVKDWCRVQARAAIEEMREPTQAMLSSPRHAAWAWRTDEPVSEADISEIWRAMIDAALAQEEPI